MPRLSFSGVTTATSINLSVFLSLSFLFSLLIFISLSLFSLLLSHLTRFLYLALHQPSLFPIGIAMKDLLYRPLLIVTSCRQDHCGSQNRSLLFSSLTATRGDDSRSSLITLGYTGETNCPSWNARTRRPRVETRDLGLCSLSLPFSFSFSIFCLFTRKTISSRTMSNGCDTHVERTGLRSISDCA